MTSRRGLQAFTSLMGIVMIVAGATTVLFGAAAVPDTGVVTPSVDSELRFYSVWYVVVGILLLGVVKEIERAGFLVRLVGGAFFAAGCARILSWAAVGRPGPTAIALGAVELVLPFVIVPWQATVAKRTPNRS